MVALSIAAVMLMFALPAFNDFSNQRRIAANANYIISAINYARNEAARQGVNATVQAEDNADGDNEWGPGFCVTLNDPGNCDTPLTTFMPEGDITINATSASLDGGDSMTFAANGLYTAGAAESIEVCGPDAASDPGREIRISAIGRASTQQFVCFP